MFSFFSSFSQRLLHFLLMLYRMTIRFFSECQVSVLSSFICQCTGVIFNDKYKNNNYLTSTDEWPYYIQRHRHSGSQKHDCMVRICAVQSKKQQDTLTEELVCCRHNFKEKVYSDHNSWWFLLLFDDIYYYSMIITILFIMDIILNI